MKIPLPSWLAQYRRQKRQGIYWLLFPLIVLPVSFTLWSILTFSAMVLSDVDGFGFAWMGAAGSIMSILSLLSFIGFVIALVKFGKHPEVKSGEYDERSYRLEAQIPDEVRGWSWAGFSLPFIYGNYHRVFLAAWLSVIPFVNIIIMILMGIKGKEWAWRNNPYLSPEDFHQAQRPWQVVGVIFTIFIAVGVLTWLFR
jgi:hypothetical protein